MLRVVTLLLRALPLPLLLLLFALAECQLVSECADVLPSTDYHRQPPPPPHHPHRTSSQLRGVLGGWTAREKKLAFA